MLGFSGHFAIMAPVKHTIFELPSGSQTWLAETYSMKSDDSRSYKPSMWGFPMIFAIETSILYGDLPAPAPGGGGQMDAVVDSSGDQTCADRGSKTPQTWSMSLKFIFMLLDANNS
jgi:hypothetical protein